ncbi:MAG: (Fe-S)-binding protein, partial [Candidatus Hodarchaeales archaeon]
MFEILKIIVFLIFLMVTSSIFLYRLFVSIRYLRLGKGSDNRFDKIPMRIWSLIIYVMGQFRLVTRKIGILHFVIFWGFLFLFSSIAQAVGEGLFPGFIIPIIGEFGPFILIQDIVTACVLIVVLYSIYYRLVLKPERYKGSNTGGAILVLLFITLIMASLLVTNGLLGILGEDTSADWRPISSLITLPFEGVSEDNLNLLLEFSWWIHIGVVLIFLTYLPEGKHFHIITSVPNVFFRKLEPKGKLRPATYSEEEEIGLKDIEKLSWKQIMDLYSCTECGRCQDVCPAYSTRGVLSPKLVIMKTRHFLEDKGKALFSGSNNKEKAILNKNLVEDAVTADELWDCITCFACSQECPLFIEHVEMIVDMRRWLAYEGMMGTSIQEVLENFSRYGNSFGQSERMRAKWVSGLDFKIKDISKEEAEFLWFVGDYASYDIAVQETTISTARVLNSIGVDFGILYEGERNSGNDVRRIGEEGLFEELVEENLKVMKKAKYTKILTTDPHSYNTIKNEYPDYGLNNKTVFHVVELIDNLIRGKEIKIKKKLSYNVTFQDPCYLGRYNDIYNPPRRILKALGCKVVEMPRNKKKSFCCEAGGGGIWKDETSGVKERPAEN